MDPICVVVISTLSVTILGQLVSRMLERYRRNRKFAILAQYNPDMEMEPMI